MIKTVPHQTNSLAWLDPISYRGIIACSISAPREKVSHGVLILQVITLLHEIESGHARLPNYYIQYSSDVTLRSHKQFTRTLEQFTQACIELLVASVLLPARNSRKIIR